MFVASLEFVVYIFGNVVIRRSLLITYNLTNLSLEFKKNEREKDGKKSFRYNGF